MLEFKTEISKQKRHWSQGMVWKYHTEASKPAPISSNCTRDG